VVRVEASALLTRWSPLLLTPQICSLFKTSYAEIINYVKLMTKVHQVEQLRKELKYKIGLDLIF